MLKNYSINLFFSVRRQNDDEAKTTIKRYKEEILMWPSHVNNIVLVM